MTINLEKNKLSIISAWKDVIDDKSDTNWALFSYDGQTNELKTVSKGDGGIEEMREELNIGKIMYAFCKVLDPKTSLFKYVLVNWQGEGAPHHRKATSANHIRDVSNLLKGFHVSVNARNEEEVDSDIIIEKLSKASAYSFKDRGETLKESSPVGTCYKRVIPAQEINSNERDKFWQKEEEDEKKRQEAEKNRHEEEKRKLESEIKQREIEESVHREAMIKEKAKCIATLQAQEKNELQNINSGKLAEKIDKGEIETIEGINNRIEMLRRQRSEEAQALISKRTINARAVFEQNTSAGQLINRHDSHQTIPSTSAVSMVKEDKSITPPHQDKEIVDSNLNSSVLLPDIEPKQSTSPDKEHSLTKEYTNGISLNNENENYAATEKLLDHYEDLEIRAQALYDYQAADETEISFDPGDIITRIDQIDAGWWQGMAPDGSYGLFPANYVQLLD